ncbi:hypothetical protein LCGC14_2154650 [marine sediment metagenome]|uniref:Uncharacterized protein n=1 Tax=marine sediment metagenome TaxID=412755 RepID=A0A0F9DUR4_9ZZZZ
METTSETKKYGLDEKLVGVTRIKKCKTKLDETMSKEESVATTITVDCRDLTINELVDKYEIAKMVIESQKVYREKGKVPETDNYTPSPDTTRVTGTISDKQIDKLDDDGTEALIKRLQARQVELKK